jgi:hypothetical protein
MILLRDETMCKFSVKGHCIEKTKGKIVIFKQLIFASVLQVQPIFI